MELYLYIHLYFYPLDLAKMQLYMVFDKNNILCTWY